MEKQLKPAIRFRGFTDPWEQRKVGEVSESYSGGTPSVGVKEYYGGQIPFIRSAEINSEITELFLTEEGLKNSSARLVAVGDILYALYGATSGEVGRARLKGAINQAILAIKPHTDYDSEYLAQWLRKSKHSIIETYLQGGQGNLSGTIVKELSVDFPSLKEQKAIGDFFRQLDNLITLHQRKYDKLQVIKKAMLEKMFPRNGSNIPEIRFRGFTDPWEQRKLGELCAKFKSGDFISAEEIFLAGNYPVYGGNGLRGYTNRYNHDGDFALIGRQGALCGNMNYSSGKAYFTEHAVAVQANGMNDTRFLFYCFSNMNLGQFSGQSAQPGLAVSKLIELTTSVPGKAEQEKISSTLTFLDNLITLHQRELEKLQKIKKAMLEKMFV